ncbi:MAG: hypothetical protein GC180_01955 [Bacteroidetes bacterium]|nr:hypothetical protein [Bacteroidota bacterium]
MKHSHYFAIIVLVFTTGFLACREEEPSLYDPVEGAQAMDSLRMDLGLPLIQDQLILHEVSPEFVTFCNDINPEFRRGVMCKTVYHNDSAIFMELNTFYGTDPSYISIYHGYFSYREYQALGTYYTWNYGPDSVMILNKFQCDSLLKSWGFDGIE